MQYSIGNASSTTGSSSMTNGDTAVPLTSTTNFQAKSGAGMVLLDEGLATEELAYSTGLSGSSLTTPLANRGLEGGSPQAHSGSFSIKGVLTAGMWNNVIDALSVVVDKTTGLINKASGAEINTGTEDAKIVTPKGIADSTVTTASKTQTLTNKTLTSPILQGDVDGWTSDTDTWVYVSASSFKVAGKDVTARFQKGTRLKFTQTTVKYAVVVGSTFSTDTTVTIAVNTDYTVANAAISANYYSYQASPQGYPTLFTMATPTITWSAGTPPTGSSTAQYKYKIDGATATYFVYRDGLTGGVTVTSASIPLPVGCAANFYHASGNLGSGAPVTLAYISTTALVMQCASTSSVDRFQAMVTYPI